MRTLIIACVLMLTITLLSGCGEERGVTPRQESTEETASIAPDLEQAAAELVATAGWPVDEQSYSPPPANGAAERRPRWISNFVREPLLGDVAHYSLQMKVGPGEYDVIGIHRVVKERRPYHPIRTEKNIFLQHGDAVPFDKFIFGIVSPNAPDERSAALFLAENDVDVWGIDQAWTLVPDGVSDLSFMADWGLQKQVDDLRIGMAVARFTRLFTGNGWDKMIMSGYSSGAVTGYATLNHEAQLPDFFRHVKGYVPVDMATKTDNESLRLLFCDLVAYYQDLHDNGVYGEPQIFEDVAILARTDPDGDSPFIPGLTNMQAALFFAAGQLFGDTPIHYVAGIWDEGLPVDLQYMTVDEWLDFLATGVAYETTLFMRDYSILVCDEEDSPFDDHWAEIDVPILNIVAAGGIGPYDTTTDYLGSTDVTDLVIQLWPPEDVVLDYGHIDIWAADNAQELVWVPLLDWIVEHCD